MSMHRRPLTPLEEAGLKAHGLDIGTPSQLSDVFRQGVAWAQDHGAAPAIRQVLKEMRERRVNHGRDASPTLQAWADRIEAALEGKPC